jgi:cytochrome c-type protein NapB
MRSRSGSVDVLARLLGIGAATVLMGVGVYALLPAVREPGPAPSPALPTTDQVPGRALDALYPLPFEGRIPDAPIPSEAYVFRRGSAEPGTSPVAQRLADALPRTLVGYRSRRAFPGAPPPIPHGLTVEEFRESRCNACHLRGGYAQRFGAYAPVTPHPEYSGCLQCHVPEAMKVGIDLPDEGRDVICRQCHVDPDMPPPSLVSLDWRSPSWPELGQRVMPASPPLIPHELQLREGCLACHAGPGAVREVRTDHPERVSCRQCHLPAALPSDAVFVRPLDPPPDGPAGSP